MLHSAMRRITIILAVLALSTGHVYAADLSLRNAPAQVYFSPRSGCTQAIVNEISSARSEILIQAYSFTSAPIADSLVRAAKRGVNVAAILDKSQRKEKYTSATFLSNSGVPVFIDSAHAIAHNKVIIIDREIVITGSFNFTKAAEEKNAENLLIIRSRDLAREYIRNWEFHRAHSDLYQRPF